MQYKLLEIKMNEFSYVIRMIRVIDKSINWNLYWNLELIRDKKQLTWVSVTVCFFEFFILSEKWQLGDLLVPTITTLKTGVNSVEKSTLDAITTTTNLWSTEPVLNKVTKTLNYRSWRRLKEGFEENLMRIVEKETGDV